MGKPSVKPTLEERIRAAIAAAGGKMFTRDEAVAESEHIAELVAKYPEDNVVVYMQSELPWVPSFLYYRTAGVPHPKDATEEAEKFAAAIIEQLRAAGVECHWDGTYDDTIIVSGE